MKFDFAKKQESMTPEVKVPEVKAPEMPKIEATKKFPYELGDEKLEETFEHEKIDQAKLPQQGSDVFQILNTESHEALKNSTNPKHASYFSGMYETASGNKFLDLAKEKSMYEPGDKALAIEDFTEQIKTNPDLKNAVIRVAMDTSFRDQLDGSDEKLGEFLAIAGEKTTKRIQEKLFNRAKKKIIEHYYYKK